MKTVIKKRITALMVIGSSCCIGAYSQTVNTGEMTILPGTEVSTVGDFINETSGELVNDGEFFVYQSFHNDGVVDYVEGGLTRFEGFAGAQMFTGTQRSYLYNALFDNATSAVPFQLYSVMSVANESMFETGIVDNEDYGGLFVFEQEGFHTGTSDGSHVDGYVLKEGSTEFLYPIGDGGFYRFAGITAPETETDGFTGKYFLVNPDGLYPLDQKGEGIELIDTAEYWTVDREFGNSDVLLTLSWRDATTPFEITDGAQEDNIHIVRWDADNAIWTDEGGVADLDNQTVTTAVSGYGVFTLARVNSDLPCELEVYNAVSANGNGVNDYFNLSLLGGDVDTNCFQNVANISVTVFNRWGVEVYKEDNYGNGNVFRGYSEGRMTINEGKKLPTGTYFYILEFDYENASGAQHYKDAGYLYLTTDDQ
ncbi:gliding motility-associated C-terminal domain-containing protein [Galbibacter sp. EGI 63066]|uniref:gliding motility-associated C-terminal domain-containing protein n=1 Tax=Galbibacter sp. EGI 63066 TaxID=2993559 RepID=UPI002248882C|nr:gliding motility-associated C-terminal domain-containing protein [Galbibacter sp. EGI 63066]MCX2678365.1 gliding motility-associated C-terminal domain-containing protein [Galbibacter sp. EGI 63066]